MIKDGKLINKEARIENTNLCNAHCVMCPREKMTRPKVTMRWKTFCDVVCQCVDLGVETASVFGYGEPLLDNNLGMKIGYCSEKGLNTWITTNGSLLSQNIGFDLINNGLKNIRFSVHATSFYNYKKIHRGLDWLTVFGNIGNFLKINNKMGHPVTTHMTVIPMNSEPIPVIRKMWEEYVDFLEIWKPHNWGIKKDYRNISPKKKSCGRPFSGPIQIQSDGNVIPCCFLMNGEIVLGNVNDSPLIDILNGEKYEDLRQMHKTGKYKNVPCETCDQRNIDQSLLYSNRDPSLTVGKTSTTKFNVEERK